MCYATLDREEQKPQRACPQALYPRPLVNYRLGLVLVSTAPSWLVYSARRFWPFLAVAFLTRGFCRDSLLNIIALAAVKQQFVSLP